MAKAVELNPQTDIPAELADALAEAGLDGPPEVGEPVPEPTSFELHIDDGTVITGSAEHLLSVSPAGVSYLVWDEETSSPKHARMIPMARVRELTMVYPKPDEDSGN